MLNKKLTKGQVGDTVTWLVATLIIIFILGIFIFISNGLAKANQISSSLKEFFSGSKDAAKADWFSVKTNLAFSKNSENKDKITEWIKNGK